MVQGSKAVKDTMPFFEIEAIVEREEDIRKLSTLENPPDIIAIYRIPKRGNDIEVAKDKFTLVLDGIQDPGNLGTIVRTAHWFGIEKIYCSKDTVDIYNPKVVLATMGSIAKVEVTYCELEDLFEANPDIPVYGLLLDGENIYRLKEPQPGFIVMGSEGHGPAAKTQKRITRALTIPPANPTDHPDSLNVAIATAITLSQMIK